MPPKHSKKQEDNEAHWSSLEDIKYGLFLIFKLQEITSLLKKSRNLFKEMAEFIPSRDTTQCKTHHQKKGITPNNITCKLQEFLEDQYETRLLDQDHPLLEFRAHLREVWQYCGQGEKEEQFLEIFQQNLKRLRAGALLASTDRQETQQEEQAEAEEQSGQHSETRAKEDEEHLPPARMEKNNQLQ